MEKRTIKPEIFGQRLKQLMRHTKETNNTMAMKFGLTPPTFSRYTRGEMCPKLTTLYRISEYFGVNPLWLSGESLYMYETECTMEDDSCEHHFTEIPVYSGIVFNLPVFSNQKTEAKLQIQNEKLAGLSPVIGFQISDDAMAPLIRPDDFVLIKLGTELISGDAIALHVGQQDMIIRKLILAGPHQVILQPLNGKFPAEYIDLNKQRLHIIGQVIYIEHSEKIWLL